MNIQRFIEGIQVTIDQKNDQIRERNAEINRLRQIIFGLYNSLSWRLTAPLRYLHAMVTGVKSNSGMLLTDDSLLIEPTPSRIEIPGELLKEKVTAQSGKSTENMAAAGSNPVPVQEVLNFHPDPIHFERETMLDFLIMPIIDWDFRFQRPQQLAVQLANHGHRVFYLKTTFTRYAGDITPNRLEINEIEKNIYQVKLVVKDLLNIYRDLPHGRQPMADLIDSIGALKVRFGIRHTISVIDHPFWWPVVRGLKNNINVYDCMDDHSGFDNNRNILTYEPGLIAEADLVVVSSDVLLNKVSGVAKRVIQVRNGTDFNHFHNLPSSDVLEKTERPTIGYYGAIAEWFDVDLMEMCVKRYPNYRFVLIGKVTNTEIAKLKSFENVIMTGEIPYRELPKYVRYFDVCLIPFKLTPLIEATNPVKFYEYISSGKPVVSVSLPELHPYRDYCYLSDSMKDFADNISEALMEQKSLAASRIELAKQNSWTNRGESFLKGLSTVFPSVTIAIITYNNLKYSRLCYQSVKKYTRYPNVEIVFVDNHSVDGTVEWLTNLKTEDPRVKILLNAENRGFAAANNQALKIADSDYFVFLNNDTLVTNQWLESLMRTLINNPSIGLLCPATNVIGNEACVRATYQNVEEIQSFAYNLTEGKATLVRNIRSVPLFCAIISVRLLRSVGGLNEDYKMGMFEDDELSEEIKKRGFRVCYAEDTFIHHFGRASFMKLPTEEYQELFKTNRKIFEAKWGQWIPPIRGWFNEAVPFPDHETN